MMDFFDFSAALSLALSCFVLSDVLLRIHVFTAIIIIIIALVVYIGFAWYMKTHKISTHMKQWKPVELQ